MAEAHTNIQQQTQQRTYPEISQERRAQIAAEVRQSEAAYGILKSLAQTMPDTMGIYYDLRLKRTDVHEL